MRFQALLFTILMLLALNVRADEAGDEDELPQPYENVQPTKALGLRTAIHKVPVQTAIGSTYQIYGEIVLPIHVAGLISVGAHAGIFPLSTLDNTVDSPNFSNLIAGLQAFYQLKFVQNQLLIPTASVEWDWMRIKSQNTSASQLVVNTVGFSLGGLISLTPFDSRVARDSYDQLGMTNAYFSFQWQPATLTTGTMINEGAFWFWGVRLEFE